MFFCANLLRCQTIQAFVSGARFNSSADGVVVVVADVGVSSAINAWADVIVNDAFAATYTSVVVEACVATDFVIAAAVIAVFIFQ